MTIATPPLQRTESSPRKKGDLQSLGARLREIPTRSGTDDEALARMVELVLEIMDVFGVAYFSRDEQGRLGVRTGHYAPEQLIQLPTLFQEMLRLAAVACSEAKAQAARCEIDGPLLLVTVPIGLDETTDEVIGIVISADQQDSTGSLAVMTQTLQLIGAFISQWKGRLDQRETDARVRQLTGLLRMVQAAATKEDLRSSGRAIAEEVRRLFDGDLVAIGSRRGREAKCSLVAVSAQEQFDRQSDLLQSIEELMTESLLRDALPRQGAAALGHMLETTVQEQLRSQTGAPFIGCYPLRHGAALPMGVLVVLAQEDPTADARAQEQLEEVTLLVAALLDLSVRSQPRRMQRILARVAGRHGVARKPATWIGLGLCLLLLAAPLPYRVSCDCQVHPAQRRYVSVPYDGRLEAVLVSPGDLVEQGQTLARMDGREIVWELGTYRAELKQAEKKYDAALADYDTAASQLARLEAERLRLEIELLEKRLERLEIKSPLPGAVIGGEPKDFVGARLTRGQTILEVAPLDRMTVELAVRDEDIAHVEPGQPVRFRLASQPQCQYDGSIARIHSQSEDRDGDNVFMAEVKFDQPVASIRPGMEGTAQVTTGRHMLAWNLFHKLWHAVLFRLGW
jgi:hypothetical protein